MIYASRFAENVQRNFNVIIITIIVAHLTLRLLAQCGIRI
jgi:hypothetical protein